MAPGRQHLRFVAPRSAYSPRAGDENLAGIQRDIHLGPNRSYGGERHQWCARRGGAGVAWRLSRKWALGAYNLAVARRPKLPSGLSRVRMDPIPCAPVAEADQEGLGVTLWSRRSCLVLGPGSRIWPNYPRDLLRLLDTRSGSPTRGRSRVWNASAGALWLRSWPVCGDRAAATRSHSRSPGRPPTCARLRPKSASVAWIRIVSSCNWTHHPRTAVLASGGNGSEGAV